MREDDGRRSVVRVRSGELAAGAGLLIAPGLVATCAHVVSDAIGEEDVPVEAPASVVEVDLPLAAGGELVWRARVQRWSPPRPDGGGDVAILRLEQPMPVPVPAVRRLDEPWDRRFRAVGFTPGREDGEWAAGVLREEQGAGWIQLAADTDGARIGPGFSGTPVWDVQAGCVVAMAVAADRGAGGAAYALPIDEVLALAPEVLSNPYRGVAAFGVEDAEFFFGRGTETVRCTDVLERTGLLVVAGGSGTGKSSLLAAGVAAGERARGRPVATARLNGAGVEADVHRLLADALTPVVAGDWTAVLSAPDTTEAARAASVRAGGALLVVDQLEELAATSPELAQNAAEAVLGVWRAGVRVAMTARWATFDLLSGDVADALRGAAVGLQALDREGLRRAVAEPARRVPGPSFAPGLAARIVDDAADEPGRLPLVQALLAELWDHPDGGLLTSAAYERAGRVEGALIASADRTWADLAPADREIARRQLVAMTRPVEGGFVRAPLDLGSLTPEARRVVEALAARRLVMVGPGPRGDVAELAHQALIEHWPLLGRWLGEDAEFLRWRDRLRAAVRRWEPARDPGTLLRGAELETALGWDRDRGPDLAPAERDLVAQSRQRRRRERGLRRGAVTALALLLVVAVVLSVVLARSNSSLATALDTANARSMAQLAQSRLSTDPGAGTQLALAAYGADPDDADARSALGQAYLARRSTTASRTIPGAGKITALTVDPDTDVAAFPAPRGDDPDGGQAGVVVSEGLAGDAPAFRTVPGTGPGWRPIAVGGRGRWVVVTGPDGVLHVWDRTGTGPPRTLGRAGPVAELTPDRSRLVTAIPGPAGTTVRSWNLADGAPGPAVGLPDPTVTRVWQSADPTRIVVETGGPDLRGTHLSVRDARTGALVRPIAATVGVAAQGAALLRCETATDTAPAALMVEDAATGAPRRRIAAQGGLDFDCFKQAAVTADGGHVVLTEGNSSPTVTRIKTIDLDTGTRGLAWVPQPAGLDPNQTSSPLYGSSVPSSTVVDSAQLAVHGDRGLLVDAGAVDTLNLASTRVGPDGVSGFPISTLDRSAVLLVGDDTITAVQAGTSAVLGRLNLAPGEVLQAAVGNNLQAVADGVGRDRIAVVVVRPGQRAQVRDYALPDLVPLGVYDTAATGAAGTPGPGPQGDYVQLGRAGDDTVILTGGVLSWWSPTRQLLAPPTTITTDPAAVTDLVDTLNDGLITTPDPADADAASSGDDAVAIREPGGVTVWRPGGEPTPITAELTDSVLNQQIYLDDRRLVTVEQPGTLVQRDPGTGAVLAAPIPTSPTSRFLGPDPDGRLVSLDQNRYALDYWDLPGNRRAGQLAFDSTSLDLFNIPRITAGRWTLDTGTQLIALPIAAPDWQLALCRAQNRDFSDVERAVLPPGADTTRPCPSPP